MFPRLRSRLVDFEDVHMGRQLRSTLNEGVQPRTQDDILLDTLFRLLHDEVFDETRPCQNGGAKRSREGTHVRTTLPLRIGSGENEADPILEHVRQWIGFDMQCAPQGGAHRGLIRCRSLLVHDA